MDIAEMDRKGRARLRINDLITKMDAKDAEEIEKYTEALYLLFELMEKLKKERVQEIKSEIEKGEG